jgi:hypothetical protein
MPEKRLRVEQLPSGVLFLRLAMGQERFGSLEALRESQTLALGVIEPLSKMYFAVLLLGDHALSGSKLGFERLLSATYPLSDYEDAIAHAAAAGRRGATKVAFDLREKS